MLYVRDRVTQMLSKLNLFDDSPSSIPHSLLIKDGCYSVYDSKTQTISYFNSIEESIIDSNSYISQCLVRSQYKACLDLKGITKEDKQAIAQKFN